MAGAESGWVAFPLSEFTTGEFGGAETKLTTEVGDAGVWGWDSAVAEDWSVQSRLL